LAMTGFLWILNMSRLGSAFNIPMKCKRSKYWNSFIIFLCNRKNTVPLIWYSNSTKLHLPERGNPTSLIHNTMHRLRRFQKRLKVNNEERPKGRTPKKVRQGSDWKQHMRHQCSQIFRNRFKIKSRKTLPRFLSLKQFRPPCPKIPLQSLIMK